MWLEKHDNNNNREWDLNNFAWSARQPAVLKEKTTTMGRLAGRFPGRSQAHCKRMSLV